MADELREKNIDESNQMSEDAEKVYRGSDVKYGFNGIQNLIDTGYKGVPSTVTNNVPSTATNNVPSTATNNVPSTVTNNVPSTVTNNVPSTATNNAPSTATNNVPSTATNNAPSTATTAANTADTSGVGGNAKEGVKSAQKKTVIDEIDIEAQREVAGSSERGVNSGADISSSESDVIVAKRLETDAALRMKGMEAALDLWKKQRDDRQALRDRELAFDEWNAKNQIAEKKALLNKLSGMYSVSWSGRATLTNGRFTHDWSGTAFNRYQTLIDQLNKGGLTAKNPYSEAAVPSDDSLDMPDWLSELVSSTERKSAPELKRGYIKMSVREPEQPKPKPKPKPKQPKPPEYSPNWGSAAYDRNGRVAHIDPGINSQAVGNDPLFTARMARRFGHVEPGGGNPDYYGQDDPSLLSGYTRPHDAISERVPVPDTNNRGPQVAIGGPAYHTTADEFIGYRKKLLARQKGRH